MLGMESPPDSNRPRKPTSHGVLVLIACVLCPTWLCYKLLSAVGSSHPTITSPAVPFREETILVDLFHNVLRNPDQPPYDIGVSNGIVLDASKFNWHWSDYVPQTAPQPNKVRVMVGDAEYRMDWRPLVIRETIARNRLKKVKGTTEFEAFSAGWTFVIYVGYQPKDDAEKFLAYWACRVKVLPLGQRSSRPTSAPADNNLVWPDLPTAVTPSSNR